jgi:hypothetical protein
MKIKTINYKILQSIKNTFKVMKITSYFGIEWCGELLNEEFFDKTYIKKIKSL